MTEKLLDLSSLGRLFPFSFVTDSDGTILSCGKSLDKLNTNVKRGVPFSSLYTISKPTDVDFEMVKRDHIEKMIVLNDVNGGHQLMGQIIKSPTQDRYFFFVNLFVNDIGLIGDLNLTFSDFAVQDQIFDFLMLLQSHKRAIAEADKINRQLAEAIKIAQHASTLKSQFLANMSHELRTPMNGVLGMSSVLAETELTEEQREYLESIVTSGQSMLNLINDILDLSKIEAGYIQLEKNPLKLAQIVADVEAVVRHTLKTKNINWVTDISSILDTEHIGDFERIKQILLNFVGNAVKFTAQGSILVSVEVVKSVDGTETIKFLVQDTGVGMTSETVEKIFNPFVQGDSSTTKKYGGTGLGLSICKKLVQSMQGEVGVESEINVGSKFWFTLKLQKVNALAA